MKITRARLSDTRPLALILKRWIRETAWMPQLHTEQEDMRFIRRLIQDKDVTVLRSWTGVHAFLARDGDMIHALYCAPRSRGFGYGAQLLDGAKARSDRLQLWCFQDNTRARAFYAREGFTEVEETDGAGNDEKLPDVRLVWERGDE